MADGAGPGGRASGLKRCLPPQLRIVREITGIFPGPSPCPLPKGARGHRTVISRTILIALTHVGHRGNFESTDSRIPDPPKNDRRPERMPSDHISGENSAQQTQPAGSRLVPPAVRHRLQKLYEHAQRCVAKGDHDYANQLLSQCVSEDPANLIYLQSFLANLQKKYDDNKKGAKFSGLKIKSQRSALSKAAAGGDWPAAFQAGCTALSLNPWDTSTLLAMAAACQELHINECLLFYLRWALDAGGKDPQVNRQAALALQRMGQFDQAIACWHRVEQAKPHDEEALQAISRLSVEKTIQQGGYDTESLTGGGKSQGEGARKSAVHGASTPSTPPSPRIQPEQLLQEKIEQDPAEIANYLQLADLLFHENRLDETEKILDRAMQASGGGDLQVRQRQEDLQIRRAQRQLAVAERQATDQPSTEAAQMAAQMRAQANQVELEVYSARVDREPRNGRLQYELGLRLKRAGKFRLAIPALQAARSDSKHKVQVLVELGECFQKIEQYKLALSHYEQAIELSGEQQQGTEMGKLALYRAGVLATGLRELDRAERHLNELAGLDFSFRDVAQRLDKLNKLRDTS